MNRKGAWRVGWLGFEGDPVSAYIKVLAKDSSDNALLITVTTAGQLPSAVAAYAYGCLAICVDSGAIYYNSGGPASCTFTAIGTVTSNSLTTAMLQSGAVTPVKMGVKNVITGTAGATFNPTPADMLNGYLKVSTIGQTYGITLPAAATILLTFTGATGAWFDYTIYNGAGHTGIIDSGAGTTILGGTAGTTQIPQGGIMSMKIIKSADGAIDAVITDIKALT